MLPDYPKVKQQFNRLLARHVRVEVDRRAPFLAQVRRTRQHEGSEWAFQGADGHVDGGAYIGIEATFELSSEEMKSETLNGILGKAGDLAEHFAKMHSQAMFAKISEATEAVGNVVDARGALTKEHFLEMTRRIQTDFDPITHEPRRASMVVHPDTWAKIKDDVQAWEEDADFVAELGMIEDEQRMAWRDREASRRLVD